MAIDESFWQKGGWGNTYNNPWQAGDQDAPFDQKFYIIFNLAVGGTGGKIFLVLPKEKLN